VSRLADVVVLTAVDLEYAAVRAHLTGLRTYTDANGTRYETGETLTGLCRVALGLTGPGNLAAAALAARAVTLFRPKAMLLVGVAGGLHPDLGLGDVVVATRVHDHHSGKAVPSGFVPRSRSWPLAHALEQDARDVARDFSWGTVTVHFKPIVSGEVVLGAADGLGEHYRDAVAVDVESAGVAAAAHHNDFHRTISVLAISGRAHGTTRGSDAAGWRRRAVTNAAAFAIALADRIATGPGSNLSVGTSPYRGLAAFGEEDASLFFGRDGTADALATFVTGRRFVSVVGESGSGKSSIVHAGLVPRVRRRGWAATSFRPLSGVPATITLAGALLPLLRPDLSRTEALAHRRMVADAIAAGRLTEVTGEALDSARADRLLVCVDRFEELDAAQDLAELLVRLATGPLPAHVVVTVRTETLDVAVQRFGEVAANSAFLLTPMTSAQLREAVEGPVRSTGVTFESGLVPRILEAAADAPAALTLTQFALTRLWDEQDHGRLTHHAYDGFGGVAGALASYAEWVWAERLDDTQRDQARGLFVRLVRPDGIRRTARASELPAELGSLAQHLATTRLLVTGADATGELTVDLAHAALATYWHRLRGWLAEERDFLAWQEDLRERVRRAEPLRGARLAGAVRWLRTHPHGIAEPERRFMITSRRRQRLRTTAWHGLLVIVVVLLGVASLLAVTQWQRGDELADQLRDNAARLQVSEARERFSTDPDVAALLSVSAYRSSRDPEVVANLAGEYLRFRDTTGMIDPGLGRLTEIALSTDGRVAAVAGSRGTALLRLDGDKPVVAARHPGDVPRVALSQDGRFLASATSSGQVEVWRADGTQVTPRDDAVTGGRPVSLRFDPTGQRLLVASDAGMTVWNTSDGSTVEVPPDLAALRANPMWFGQDGTSVVVATDELRSWPLDGGEPTLVTTVPASTFVTVTDDGRTAITCADGKLTHWDLTTATEARSTTRDCPEARETAADPTGRLMVLDSPREGVSHPRDVFSVVDMENGAVTRVVTPVPADPLSVVTPRLAATPSGPRLVTAVGAAVVLTDLTQKDFTALEGWTGGGPLLSPDLRFAVTKAATELRLWDVATGAELAKVDRDVQPDRFSTDGRYLLASAADHASVTVFSVPAMEVVAEVTLPAGDGTFPADFLCLADLPRAGELTVVHSGLMSRLDLRAGTLSKPVQLWRGNDTKRLAGSRACRGRPGHREVAFDTADGVEVWNVDTGRRTATLPVLDLSMISGIRFSQDGRFLAAIGIDGSLALWDVDRRRPADETRHAIGATEVRGFPDLHRVVLRGVDVLRVWDVDQDATLADVETPAPDSGVVAGDTLLYWGPAGLTRMPLDPNKWADLLCERVGRDLTDAERDALPPGSDTSPVC
jgi:nucleoside phosphorylase/WD40 repeat protein